MRRAAVALWLLVACGLLSGCDLFTSPDERVERATRLIEQGDYRAADIELRNALQKAPDHARGRALLARTTFWRGDAVAADRELERALAAGVPPAEVARLRADLLRALGRYPDLEAHARSEESGLDATERAMFLGYAQLGLGQPEAARASFAAAVAITQGPARAETLTAQAVGQAASGDTTAALESLDAALAAAPGDLQVATVRANLLVQLGEFAPVEALMTPLLGAPSVERAPVADRVAGYDALCEALLGQGKLDDAVRCVDRLAQVVPGAPLVGYQKGRLALAQGHADEAINLLQQAVRGAPEFLPARMVLGLANLTEGNFAQAEAELQRVVQGAPDNIEARQLLAQAHLRQGRIDAAATVLEPALAVAAREGLPSLASLGQLEIQAGREDSARRAYQAAIEANPAAPQPRLLLARLEFRGRNPSAGRALVAEAVALEPTSPAVADAAGLVLLEAGLYDEALGQFRRASTLDERDPAHLLGAARAQLALGMGAAGRQSLERALLLRPNWPPAVVLLVQVEMRERRVPAALMLATGLQRDPATAPLGHLIEGDILLSTGQSARAEQAYEASARARPSREAAVGQARARVQGQVATPEQPLAAWVKAHPTDAAARLELAQVLQVTGRVDAAVAEYEAVLRQQPDALVALNNLAWLYGERGDTRAVEVARRAVAIAPGAGPVLDTLGWSLVQAGQLDEGLKYVQQAHDLDRENPEIAYHLGVALLKSGRAAEARAPLDGAIAAGGDAPWVAAARKAREQAGP